MAENNELREMIEQNIVPNGTKGITGQGLKNTLLEMADAIGQGGGGSSAGGAGVVFYVGSVNIETFETMQTAEQKAHNAEMFQIFANSPMGVPVSINLNAVYEEQFGVSEGVTYIVTMTDVMYAREDVANAMGVPSAMIEAFNADFNTVISPDGTLVLELNAE